MVVEAPAISLQAAMELAKEHATREKVDLLQHYFISARLEHVRPNGPDSQLEGDIRGRTRVTC